jgi:hypothetical protein
VGGPHLVNVHAKKSSTKSEKREEREKKIHEKKKRKKRLPKIGRKKIRARSSV